MTENTGENTNNNVIILGAGASYDAGIPLLGDLVEKMRRYAFKGSSEDGTLSLEDKEIFQKAMEVLYKLDEYHGRAAFDDRNIEDVLSILSFNTISGDKKSNADFDWMVKAVSRTIELSCKIHSNLEIDQKSIHQVDIYKNFWTSLFDKYKNSNLLPTIISFNYDLVLERSLFLSFNKDYDYVNELPYSGLIFKYHIKTMPDLGYLIKFKPYYKHSYGDVRIVHRPQLEPSTINGINKPITIEILNLHGSLNFSKAKNNIQSIIENNNSPLIIPPISNKVLSNEVSQSWCKAINRLRTAKNIVIVGYSMPQTDTYMQYFFKTALGPNRDLEKVTVFDPALFTNDDKSKTMKERYSNCFSEQLRRQVNFNPKCSNVYSMQDTERQGISYKGTFKHFVDEIPEDHQSVFFD